MKQLVREWRRRRVEIFVPLTYKPGDLAEVDFFQVLVEIAGARIAAWMFVLRLMFSGRDFAWLYPRQDQVCFLDGHVRAFEHLGVAPHRVLCDYVPRQNQYRGLLESSEPPRVMRAVPPPSEHFSKPRLN